MSAASFTGYDPAGWADSVWVLHAMFERDGSETDVTYHEARQRDIASGCETPLVTDGVDLEQGAVATGVPLGFVRTPGPPWRRLRWAELAAQEQLSLGNDLSWPPCDRWFPFSSWPVRMLPPPEGSLDETSLTALLRVLVEHTNHEALSAGGAPRPGMPYRRSWPLAPQT